MWNPKKNIKFAQLQGFCDILAAFILLSIKFPGCPDVRKVDKHPPCEKENYNKLN